MTQHQALDLLKLGKNVFLTGPAGSGKTYVLNKYIQYVREGGASLGITASTGIAATHIGGITIHSWCGMGVKELLTKGDVNALRRKSYLKKHFNSTNILIIDEVSMLHDFQLDIINTICKGFKENNRPFGGMQVILCGDFFQLPPVSKDRDVHFVYESEAWKALGVQVCYLEGQYRHEDADLSSVLMDIRTNNVNEDTLAILDTRYQKEIQGEVSVTKLYTHNVDVDAINEQELQEISGKARRYRMLSYGNRLIYSLLEKSCLAPKELILKQGASVMFVKNSFDEGYVNGTLGEVVDFNEAGMPLVQINDGRKIQVKPQSWVVEEGGERVGEIRQVPLRLAWAITVHKSQGLTLDAAEMDLSKSFEPGMGYVALSRVRTLDGLRLMGLNNMALAINEEVLEEDAALHEASLQAAELLDALSPEQTQTRQKEFLHTLPQVSKQEKKVPTKKGSTYEQTKQLIIQKKSIHEISKERSFTEGTIIKHVEKLVSRGELHLNDISHLRPEERDFNKMKDAFDRSESKTLTEVKNLLHDKYSFAELRIGRLFLDLENSKKGS